MISARLKDFLKNLGVVSLLVAVLFGGFFLRKQIFSFISTGRDNIFRLVGKEPKDFAYKTEGVNVKGEIGGKDFDTVQGVLEFSRDSEFILDLHGEKGKVIYDGDPYEDEAMFVLEKEGGRVELIKMKEIQEGYFLVFFNPRKDINGEWHSRKVVVYRELE